MAKRPNRLRPGETYVFSFFSIFFSRFFRFGSARVEVAPDDAKMKSFNVVSEKQCCKKKENNNENLKSHDAKCAKDRHFRIGKFFLRIFAHRNYAQNACKHIPRIIALCSIFFISEIEQNIQVKP